MKIFSTLGEVVVGYLRGAKKGGTPSALVTSSDSGPNRQTLDVAIYDAGGNRINDFGGNKTPVPIDSSSHGETNLIAADLMLNGKQVQPGPQRAVDSLPVVFAGDQLPGINRRIQGVIAKLNDSVIIDVGGCSTVSLQIQALSGTHTMQTQVSMDGINWNAIATVNPVTGALFASYGAATAQVLGPVGGMKFFRLVCTAYTSGSSRITIEAGPGVAAVSLANPIPAGTASIGAVTMLSQIVDNAAFTDGSTSIQMAGYTVDETRASTQTVLAEGDGGAARITPNRQLVTSIEDATTRGQRVAVSADGRLAVSNDELRRIEEIEQIERQAALSYDISQNGETKGLNWGFEVR